ncbi:glycosyltransferase [Orrella daihaiensis]|uniref:Glycosyltransferase family 2 protein n=1 Tax=Orrella daihaiensis TaxID=2782176 RepID=A0ABY4AI63_9BURK|nr:glycosyltransferase family 2 protein [Orrella daihaiensis]UOD49979.1 glycosyltransferase family 2 protein [Orrella daihaiensis]
MEHPFLTAILVIALEIPRYTLAIFALGITKIFRPTQHLRSNKSVTAIIPSYNGGADLRNTVHSLIRQKTTLHEIIVVDDGSSDGSCDFLEALSQEHANLRLLRHSHRAGKSAAINHAAYLATGELLLVVDHDTSLDPDACLRLACAFEDTSVAAASGNLLVGNLNRNPLTALQSLEYMLAITIGRGFLNQLNAMSCCSGAFSMFRADAYRLVGGMNVGPGEDLEITLRLRHAGYKIRFVDSALAETSVPSTIGSLFKQRLRWDGDAIAIRLLMYRELSFFKAGEPLSGSLQRFDYILLELLPTIIFPFYLVMLWVDYGTSMIDILTALYIALFWLYALNIVLAMIITKRRVGLLDVLVLPLMPIYQGVILRLVRLVGISDEILLARSHNDPLVPRQVRLALYGDTARD